MIVRKILSGFGKTLKWGFITLVLICGLLLAINAVDEDPSPELEALLAIPQIKATPANGYLAFVGIDAPANQDIVSYGAAWVDANNAATDHAAILKTASRFSSSDRLKFRGDDKQLCNPSKIRCLPQAREHAGEWRKLAADNELMLARQRQLLKFADFEESYFMPSAESAFPGYTNRSRRLALNMIALDAAEGRVAPALAALESHIAFDRLALLGSRSLLMGIMATSWLAQDYALLAEIVATRSRGLVAEKARLARMTEPLQIAQIRTVAGRIMEGEFRARARGVNGWQFDVSGQDSEALLNVMTRPLFKRRATQNMEARYHALWQARVRDFSPEHTDAWVAQARRDDQKEIDAIYSWRFLYNPVTKFAIAAYGMPEYGRYILKLPDLMGIMRLARLQVEAATAGKAADISAVIAGNQALYDPYTGKPMGWDAGKRQLSFDARGYYSKDILKHIQAGI